MRSAPRLLDQLSGEDAAHFAAGQGPARRRERRLRDRPARSCAAWTTTRAPSSSSPPTRSARRAASAAAGRYDGLVEELGGPPDARHRLGRRDRADHARGRHAARRPHRRSSCSSRCERGEPRAAADRASVCSARPRSAGLAAQMDLGGRSLKGQLGHAERARRPLRSDRRRRADHAPGHAGGRAGPARHRRRRPRGAARSSRALSATGHLSHLTDLRCRRIGAGAVRRMPAPRRAPQDREKPSRAHPAAQLLCAECRRDPRWRRSHAHSRSPFSG